MWQIICLCLPAVPKSEQQRFSALFENVSRGHKLRAHELDLSLFFLHALSPAERLTVLEERLDLVVRSQEVLETQRLEEQSTEDSMQTLMEDHMRTLLSAEQEWLERTLTRLRLLYAHNHHWTDNE